ncbi:PHA/PHB synthase family protein [Chiayiivirga flava]|uniref:Polyhydroxyalkanoate synthase n=1 Tax=Chiayiivirga flava TaxID=659595 RepID=A0A7W8FXM8_9GAMM|nr:alpha/beta fold hydrolase [Chiayiivirga flava]MBB5206542.1 polyhydroxyalkanoate synthase [Chiayiivirga flava]
MNAAPRVHRADERETAAAAAGADRAFRGLLARLTGALSPASSALALYDWMLHLAGAPGHQLALTRLATRDALALLVPTHARAEAQETAAAARFADVAWNRPPYDALRDAFLACERWWQAATHGVPGVAPHHERLVAFGARQWLDLLSPTNTLLGNPVAWQRTVASGGANLVAGALHAIEDAERLLLDLPPAGTDAFVPGRTVACTPGRVVLRNRLVELIQYAPTTRRTRPEPILLVPAWIMKYYVLDLTPRDSLVRFLVDAGFTVFCLSWKNPDAQDRGLGLEHYLDLGVRASLDAIGQILRGARVHAVGYCLGGTLLAMAAAAMGRDGDTRLASVTLLAAQTDFTEPGELGLFIDHSQVAYLEDRMADTGYLGARQMAGAFQMLRSYDLLWSRLVRDYLLGERAAPTALAAWNADTTRMPARMHAQYLRQLFLDNDLAAGRYRVDGRPVSLHDIRGPVFCVATERDHVAPWPSVYKLHALTDADLTFVLVSGGHNVGIVNPPGAARGEFRQQRRAPGAATPTPDAWRQATPAVPGSWWPAWRDWLAARSGALRQPPTLGARGARPRADAPGTYVHVRQPHRPNPSRTIP